MKALPFLLVFACSSERAALPDQTTPRCSGDETHIQCYHQTNTIVSALLEREVHWQLPRGTPPPEGFPAVILFQGAFHRAAAMWSAQRDDERGGYHQTEVIRALLENGFAVLTPEAKLDGLTYWESNVPPMSFAWSLSADNALMEDLFVDLEDHAFGAINMGRLYAAGISSGGYMTSRMADAYPGKFRALAIHSASWATCSGPICSVPNPLPAQHPPVLFLHGEEDDIVPIGTARSYEAQLRSESREVRFVTDPQGGHGWLQVAPREIVSFFVAH